VPHAGSRAYRIGCSGWNYDSWRHGVFYPERCPARKWLGYYARHFDTVEVNATFYRLPTVKTVQAWVDQTPDDFSFAVKMSRYVTHVKRLRDLAPSLDLFYLRLSEALARLPAGRHCFEFRHESWFVPEVMALLREHGVALVIGDRPEVHSFQTHELTADWTFVRFHSGTRGARGNYSETELREWAERLRSWRTREAFIYFNNDWEGFAPRNALRLRELLAENLTE
jgi:uncharacterized protein YecE (DUF72 family)